MNNMFSKAAIWVVIALVLFTVFKQFDERGLGSGATPIAYSDFLEEVKSQHVREATIEDRTSSRSPPMARRSRRRPPTLTVD